MGYSAANVKKVKRNLVRKINNISDYFLNILKIVVIYPFPS